MRKSSDEKLQNILTFIQNYISNEGFPPSIREICSALEIRSTSTVHAYIEKLQSQGLLSKMPSKTRAIKVDKLPQKISYVEDEVIEVPLLGKISAGEPMLATENIEDTILLPGFFTKNSECFVLKVQGESMKDAGIFEDDYIVVRKQNTAQSGDIVVALLEDEATVKTFQKKSDGIWLVPQNESMSPFKVNNPIILGKVVSVFRKY